MLKFIKDKPNKDNYDTKIMVDKYYRLLVKHKLHLFKNNPIQILIHQILSGSVNFANDC